MGVLVGALLSVFAITNLTRLIQGGQGGVAYFDLSGIVLGVVGAALGEILLKVMPLRSTLARGALFGMGAHGAGVAKAHQIGGEEGSIAGLVMVLAGLFNVMMAPVVAYLLR